MRSVFSERLVHFAQNDKKILLLTGDHGYALFDDFRKYCAAQYVNAGIAEQNMVGLAAGLARAGFRPVVYGLSAFVPVRVLEQIKMDVCHDNLPVIFIGDGAGFVYSHLGTSHQSTEDIACLRAIPGLTIFSPADRFEMHHCMELAFAAKMPVYLRMGKSDRGDVHRAPVNFSLGELVKIKDGKMGGVTLLGTGSMVKSAVNVATKLGDNVSVWSVPCLKSIDASLLVSIAQKSKAIITIEEHSVYGGLGSIVAEILSELYPLRICRIGVADRFSEYCGDYNYLLEEHKLDDSNILKKVRTFLQSLG